MFASRLAFQHFVHPFRWTFSSKPTSLRSPSFSHHRLFSSSSSSSPTPPTPPPSSYLSSVSFLIPARLKKVFQQYGRPAFWTYMTISTFDLSLTFLAVQSGWLDTWILKTKPWFEHIGVHFPAYHPTSPPTPQDSNTHPHRNSNSPSDPSSSSSSSTLPLEKKDAKPSWVKSFVIAYAFHKLLLPLRVPLTIAVTPSVVRVLKSTGWMR